MVIRRRTACRLLAKIVMFDVAQNWLAPTVGASRWLLKIMSRRDTIMIVVAIDIPGQAFELCRSYI